MIGETVTILHVDPAGYDEYGDPNTSTQTETTVDGCAVAPRFSDVAGFIETDQRGRAGVVIGYTVYAPPGTVVKRTDRMRVRGVEYDVDGEPGVWISPFEGVEKGVEIALKYGEG